MGEKSRRPQDLKGASAPRRGPRGLGGSLGLLAAGLALGAALTAATFHVLRADRSPAAPAPSASRPAPAAARAAVPVPAAPRAVPAESRREALARAVLSRLERPPRSGSPPGSPPAAADVRAWLEILADPEGDLGERLRAATKLAILGTDEALLALSAALESGPSPLAAGVAEALGECRHPEARALLETLLGAADEAVARGAIRGLGRAGDPEALEALAGILGDEAARPGARGEAAYVLGEASGTAALEALVRAAHAAGEGPLRGEVLAGLGARPFAETEGFFREYLGSPETSPTAKAAALEALGDSRGNPAPVLLEYAAHADPALREASAAALAAAEETGEIGESLVRLLATETVPDVRLGLYQALESQASFDLARVQALVLAEEAADVRLAGLGLLAAAGPHAGDAAIADHVERDVVPELEATAIEGAAPRERMASVIALRRAGTPAAVRALERIAEEAADPQVVEAARMALRRFRR
jgi:HEAT repeat protein